MRMTRMVVSFNRHFFLLAFLACVAGVAGIVILDNPAVRVLLTLGCLLAVYFMIASVITSYVVYDASDLYKLTWWPHRCFAAPPGAGIVAHAGFDPASPAIQQKYPDLRLRVLDFFDARRTTEASIQRAHLMATPSGNEEKISAISWPVDSASQDVVFALSAAHELRRSEERIAFFREAKRVLKEGGKVIVIEQLRDLANFACFGVAAFHFLSRSTWLESFAAAGLTKSDEFTISPWMRVFVLR